MIADPTLKASCVRTSGQVNRLSEWLVRNAELAGMANCAIRQAVSASSLELKRLAEAAERSPALGLIGGTDTEKSEFVTALLRPDGKAGRIGLGQRKAGLGAISSILPGEEDGGAAMIVRFHDAGTTPPPGANDFYPIGVSLLSQTDLAAIFCLAYFTHVPAALHRGLAAHEMNIARAAAQDEMSVHAVPGLSATDIGALRLEISSQLPGIEALQELSALGYWEWLGDHVSHMRESARRRMLALLWHNEPQLTGLFNRLCDGVNALGNSYRIFCPHEAVISSDPSTGWVARHRSSIASAATLRELAIEPSAASRIRVSAGGSSVIEIERAMLSAIATELTIGVDETRLSRLAPAEIVAFPGVGQLNDTTARLLMLAGKDKPGEVPLDVAVDLFARTKSTFLFERACSRHEITALVVRVDPKSHDDDIHAATIADWVDVAQGDGPNTRERMETGLSVIASPLVSATKPSPLDSGSSGTVAGDSVPGMGQLDAISADSDWHKEWTPGRRFERTHLIDGSGSDHTDAATPTVLMLSGSRLGEPHRSAVADRVAPGGAGVLEAVADQVFEEISAACTPTVKARQIRQQLDATQKAIRARLVRYHQSNDPARFMDWRKQIANVASTRLEACRSAGRIGKLLEVLSPAESQLILVVSNLTQDLAWQGTPQSSQPSRSGGRQRFDYARPTPDQSARAIIGYWLNTMFEAARCRRTCRKVGIAQPVLQHIVDELAFGAVRLDLSGELTHLLAAIDVHGQHSGDASLRYAAVAKRLIGTYLERPAPFNWNGIGEHAAPTGADAMTSRGRANTDYSAVSAADTRPSTFSNIVPSFGKDLSVTFSPAQKWPGAFLALVERNISAAGAVAARSEIDRELGEQLSAFTLSPFEVDL